MAEKYKIKEKLKIFFIALLIAILFQVMINFFKSQSVGGNSISEELKSTKAVEENFGENEYGFVTKIIDGDTIIVSGKKIRLLGIDAPERGEKCYRESKNWLENRILKKRVKLVKERKDKDFFGRYLRYVFLNNSNINVEIVREGFAIARIDDIEKFKGEILSAEEMAIENKKGCIWVENPD